MSASARATADAARGRSRSLVQGWLAEVESSVRGGSPVALVTGTSAPIEVFRAAGILPLLPPVSSLVGEAIPLEGLAPEGCGACAPLRDDERLLISRLGLNPAIVVSTSAECREHVRFLELLAARGKAPLLSLDVPPPPAPGGFVPETQARASELYVKRQLEALASACAGVVGRPLERSRLSGAVKTGARAEAAWARLRTLGRSRPSPFDAYFDLADHLGALACLRGTDDVAAVLEASAEAFAVLAAVRKGPLVEERYRLIVEGPPPASLGPGLREAFERRGVVAVAATYSCFAGVGTASRRSSGSPLRILARRLLRERRESRSVLETPPEELAALLRAWKADGVLRLSMNTCAAAASGAPPRALGPSEPVLLLSGDFGKAVLNPSAEAQIDEFLDRILSRRRR